MGGALGLTAQRKDSPRDTGVPRELRRTGKKPGGRWEDSGRPGKDGEGLGEIRPAGEG